MRPDRSVPFGAAAILEIDHGLRAGRIVQQDEQQNLEEREKLLGIIKGTRRP